MTFFSFFQEFLIFRASIVKMLGKTRSIDFFMLQSNRAMSMVCWVDLVLAVCGCIGIFGFSPLGGKCCTATHSTSLISQPVSEEERIEPPSRKHHPRMKNLYFMDINENWSRRMCYTWLKRMRMKWVQMEYIIQLLMLCVWLRETLTIRNTVNPHIYFRLLIIYADVVYWHFVVIRTDFQGSS